MLNNTSEAARALVQARWDKTDSAKRKAHGKMLADARKRAKAKAEAKKKLKAEKEAILFDTPLQIG